MIDGVVRYDGSKMSLLDRRLILCMGSGGVGKTTTAAAIATAAARRGRSCGLITVDPARRLRSALGLDQLSATPTRIDIEGSTGALYAMAVDTKSVFDELVVRAAPSAAVAARVLDNPLYRELSNELGGSTEYMAMEKLHQLVASEQFELIVVDTPPSAHVRDLLGAPARVATLVDSGAARVLRAPSSILRGNPLADATLGAILRLLERWIGSGLIRNLADFAAAFEPMLGGFRERAQQVQDTLRDGQTAIVLVTSAESAAIRATAELAADLGDNGLAVAGIIANQVTVVAPLKGRAQPRCSAAVAARLRTNYADYRERCKRDHAALDELASRIAPLTAVIPRMQEPVASLDDLTALADILGPQL